MHRGTDPEGHGVEVVVVGGSRFSSEKCDDVPPTKGTLAAPFPSRARTSRTNAPGIVTPLVRWTSTRASGRLESDGAIASRPLASSSISNATSSGHPSAAPRRRTPSSPSATSMSSRRCAGPSVRSPGATSPIGGIVHPVGSPSCTTVTSSTTRDAGARPLRRRVIACATSVPSPSVRGSDFSRGVGYVLKDASVQFRSILELEPLALERERRRYAAREPDVEDGERLDHGVIALVDQHLRHDLGRNSPSTNPAPSVAR